MLNLYSLGWNAAFQAQLDEWNQDRTRPGPGDDDRARPALQAARIAVVHGTKYELLGCDTRWAELTGRLRHRAEDPLERPAVGDWVAVAGERIHHVLPRRTRIVRQAAGGRTTAQVVAANVDVVFVVTAPGHDFNPRRIERYLTVAWDSGARPVLVLNKVDLVDGQEGEVASALDGAREGDQEADQEGAGVSAGVTALLDALGPACAGVAVVTTSALAGTELDALRAHIGPGCTAALVGSSGVGKSTLANGLLGRGVLRTGSIRESDGRGRHTTTHRELFLLDGGGVLVDTPGMRELGLWDAGDGLDTAFADIDTLARSCRFRDCRHQGEPGCAVVDEIAPDRLDSYARLAREQAYRERQRDARVRIDTKRRWKQVNKAMRARNKLDDKPRS